MSQLSSQQHDFWKRNSYLVLDGMFGSKMDKISSWVDETYQWPVEYSKWLKFFEMDDKSKLSRIENFVPFHNGLADVLNGKELLGIISELMGCDAVLYKDRINFKQPGGGAHTAHQDGVAYEQGDAQSFDPTTPYISALISVDEATAENGCLQVVPNWPLDKLEILPMEKPLKHAPGYSKISQSTEDALVWKKLHTKPGDLVIFTERLPHRSTSNQSGKPRRILYGVYNPLSEGDKRAKYFNDKRLNINDARYMVGNPHASITMI
ncbi:MAG: phytanoyl-CoA dioxygenase family protein [Cyclobacteriaceae bacterium]|nr:phytanoyl-CoA dioxygenase family protein [Cyclobacteriaceae bacterium HetDA_MAG_MS6]